MSKKISLIALKYAPFIGVLIMLQHVALLLFGYEDPLTEFLCDSSVLGLVLFLAGSYALEFCLLHRACIVYTYIVSFCIDYQRRVGFGDLRRPAQVLVLIIGIVLVILFIRAWISKRARV